MVELDAQEIIGAIFPIASRYIANGGFISEDTINSIYEFISFHDDEILYLSTLKNVLEDAVDEALNLYA